MKRKIIFTEDGSKTIHLPEINESYHSVHGAVQEAQHVFIKSGLYEMKKDNISILEIGFGTGLNTILTYTANKAIGKEIFYTTIESFPVSQEEIKALNYVSLTDIQSNATIYHQLHQCEWGKPISMIPNFTFLKILSKIQDYQSLKQKFDLIYFDAFGPRVQPEMWAFEILEKLYFSLTNNGVFVTYCSKGEVRRNLEKIGFQVEKIPGPPGKREMLRGRKIKAD